MRISEMDEIEDWLFEIATGTQILGREHSYEKDSELANKCLSILKEQDNCENCAIAIEDRQPVIRCKDCEFRGAKINSEYNKCERLDVIRSNEWFCADGERKKLEGEA